MAGRYLLSNEFTLTITYLALQVGKVLVDSTPKSLALYGVGLPLLFQRSLSTLIIGSSSKSSCSYRVG